MQHPISFARVQACFGRWIIGWPADPDDLNLDYRNESPSQHSNYATMKDLGSGRSPRHGHLILGDFVTSST
jgi:hypothetical protein